MNCEDYKIMIQEFHDRELQKSKEPLVFTHLSQCNDCRDFFKGLNLLNAAAQEESINYPFELDEKIMMAVEKRETRKYSIINKRIPAYVSYALGAIIILLMLYMFDTTNDYKHELKEAVKTMKEQNQQLHLIMNSYPEIQVQASYPYEVIVQANL